MNRRLLISENEKDQIKKMYGLINEQNFLEDLVKKSFGSILNPKQGGESTTDSKEDILKSLYGQLTKSDEKSINSGSSESQATSSNSKPDFKEITKLVINKIEGGYYNPKWHYKSAMGKSGETMFGIDRKHGGTINTTGPGIEFWKIIDDNKSPEVWKHGYRGGNLESTLTDLAARIMEPVYERNSEKYLSPEARKVVESDKPLLFHFIYASWNGPGFFKKFAEKINEEVKKNKTPEQLRQVALNSRRESAVSGSSSKIEDIFNNLA